MPNSIEDISDMFVCMRIACSRDCIYTECQEIR